MKFCMICFIGYSQAGLINLICKILYRELVFSQHDKQSCIEIFNICFDYNQLTLIYNIDHALELYNFKFQLIFTFSKFSHSIYIHKIAKVFQSY